MQPSPTSAEPPATTTATVVVARTTSAATSRHAARSWFDDLISQAAEARGYRRAEIQPPDPRCPNEWTVVYEFADRENLEAWLSSPERLALIARESEFFVGEARQQIVATRPAAPFVTAISSFALGPIGVDQFETRYNGLVAALANFEGFIQSQLFKPDADSQRDTVVVFSFERREDLDTWLQSDARRDLMADIEPLLTKTNSLNIISGFGGWFPAPDQPVKTWKQATLVLGALYPTSLAVGWLRTIILPDLAGPAVVLFGNAVGVIVLSWMLMPILTEQFSQWLHR